jgi:signal peptidase I
MALSLLVKTFLIQPFHIPSASMEDTLIKDDRVIVSKLTPGPFDLARGDIVVFADPDGWLGDLPEVSRTPLSRLLIFLGLAPDDSNEHLIKRVIGLPGDNVSCCDVDGRVQVNGTSIVEPYIKPGDTPNGGREPFSITVPEGRVWVMGDHRSDSADSRLHDDGTGAVGSVPIDKITGRAVATVWPLARVTWLTAPERVFGSVPPPSASKPPAKTATSGAPPSPATP